MNPDRLNRMLAEERDLARAQLEDEIRERFRGIIGGRGVLVPRIAVKIALDDVFGPEDRDVSFEVDG